MVFQAIKKAGAAGRGSGNNPQRPLQGSVPTASAFLFSCPDVQSGIE
jgi:hypothetical protein